MIITGHYGTIQLYKYDSLQMSDKLSMLTDTAAYFLTVNSGINKRFTTISNDVAGNVLAPETGFTHLLQKLYVLMTVLR